MSIDEEVLVLSKSVRAFFFEYCLCKLHLELSDFFGHLIISGGHISRPSSSLPHFRTQLLIDSFFYVLVNFIYFLVG